jgi:hypothetical protein
LCVSLSQVFTCQRKGAGCLCIVEREKEEEEED